MHARCLLADSLVFWGGVLLLALHSAIVLTNQISPINEHPEDQQHYRQPQKKAQKRTEKGRTGI
jgi:hypothetical protein